MLGLPRARWFFEEYGRAEPARVSGEEEEHCSCGGTLCSAQPTASSGTWHPSRLGFRGAKAPSEARRRARRDAAPRSMAEPGAPKPRRAASLAG